MKLLKDLFYDKKQYTKEEIAANYFLVLQKRDYSCNKYYSLSNMKLNKLLFFYSAICYKIHNEIPFTEEFRAWQYGISLESVYMKYRKYGQGDIYSISSSPIPYPNKEEQEVIEHTWRLLKNYDSFSLAEATIETKIWKDVYENPNYGSDIISNEKLIQFFKKEFIK